MNKEEIIRGLEINANANNGKIILEGRAKDKLIQAIRKLKISEN